MGSSTNQIKSQQNKFKCWFLERGENRRTRGKISWYRVENQQTNSIHSSLESPLESRVVSKEKRVGKVRTPTRNWEYTRGEGSGAILSAGVFFPLFFRSAKSKVTRRSYATRHLSMRTTLNLFVLYLNVYLISNLLFFC